MSIEVGVEERQLLGAVHFINCVIDVERDRRERRCKAVAKLPDEGAGALALALANAREVTTANANANAIAPGYCHTSMVAAMPQDVLAQITAQIPVGRLG